MTDEARRVGVVVVGAGQAGLSAAYHLQRRGVVSALEHPEARLSFVVLDADAAPGGAWQHRWESLRMATVNGIFDLPGFEKPPIDAAEASREAVPRYFAEYERRFDLPVLRPVRVTSVRPADPSPHADPEGPLLIETDAAAGGGGGPRTWLAERIINATGTWGNPVLPAYPGQESFLGRQLHTRDYVDLEEFRGHRVAVVGGGISAVQQLEEISRVAWTAWYTRREPVFLDGEFGSETGRDTIARVTADVEAGRPSSSVVSYTGLIWTPYAVAARDRGALERRPMFTALEPHGVREADGSFTSVDTVLWATGFRADLAHLDPLHLRNEQGGITLRGTEVVADPRVHLIGFGPSQSTVGANRAGRAAASAVTAALTGGAGQRR
ncbi:NAD(P)-binding domain-containing protein [Herbiconiux sp. P15]|uniref:NAD(P)-binding domain-containing protein n=1 Tax=Herbiconiux liukaitaii TaxID=3342799 RepID=UPI0035BB54B5